MAQADLSPRIIKHFNAIGFYTLFYKEVKRFISVIMQTILAPVVTILLYYVVFSVAFGAGTGETKAIGDVPYLYFLIPGLVIMAMTQNAFINTSSSLLISKYDGSIVDVLMPPLSPLEFGLAKILAGAVRGLIVGVVALLTFMLLVDVPFAHIGWIIYFGFSGAMLLSTMGLITGIWAEKFDHTASITNFIVTPLTFLSGTFYSIQSLPEWLQGVIYYNPFFYMIDGFRYGFTDFSDASVTVGAFVLLFCNLILGFGAVLMLQNGYKLKS